MEIPAQGDPGADESLCPMATVEILPGVHLPAPQREQRQKVFSRLALWGLTARGGTRDQGRKRSSRE